MSALSRVASLRVRFPSRAPWRPSLAPRGASAPRRPLRRSLRASIEEGLAAEVVGACTGGAALMGWALHLGCSVELVAFLGALPFVAQLVQVPAARLTARLGPRRVTLVALALSRQAFLPLALLPFLPVGPAGARAMLVVCAAAHHGLGVACNNGWIAWMGELVPARVRGRYFGRRTAVTTAAGAAAALAAGALLDRGPGAFALAALALASCVAGAASSSSWRASTAAAPGRARRRGRRRSRRCCARPAARRYLAYLVVSGAGAGLIVPFAALFVLRDLALGFTFLSGHGAISALARTASAHRWGRAVDRAGGARAAVVASTALLAASPLLWLAAAGAGPWVILVGGGERRDRHRRRGRRRVSRCRSGSRRRGSGPPTTPSSRSPGVSPSARAPPRRARSRRSSRAPGPSPGRSPRRSRRARRSGSSRSRSRSG